MKNCSGACSHSSSSTTDSKESKEVPQQQINYTVLDNQRVTQVVAKINLRDDPDPPTDWNTILYFILGTIGFYLLSGPITYLFSMEIWPNTDTGSADFKSVYYRYYVNTTYISFGVFLFFIVMYCVGFAFVEVVNL